MKITAIEPQARHPDRVEIRTESGSGFTVAREVVLRHDLAAGQEITARQIDSLGREDLSWKAREAALNLLSHRPRTALELTRRLRRKGFPEETSADCVRDLARRGLVDDTAFSEAFVRDRIRFRPRGKRRLVQELRSKGVDPETAEAAVGEVVEAEEVSELDLARDAASRWSPRRGEDPQRARRRLYAFLARRGFAAEVVRTVAEELAPL